LVTDDTEWEINGGSAAYCWFRNDQATYGDTYGALYKVWTMEAGQLCPIGWHVPTAAEWRTLEHELGGEDVAGGKLKESGTEHWNAPNTDATNESGFTALPGGFRSIHGSTSGIGHVGYWWSSTIDHPNANYRQLVSDESSINGRSLISSGNQGFSVRCIKD